MMTIDVDSINVYYLKGNATLKHYVLQREELNKP